MEVRSVAARQSLGILEGSVTDMIDMYKHVRVCTCVCVCVHDSIELFFTDIRIAAARQSLGIVCVCLCVCVCVYYSIELFHRYKDCCSEAISWYRVGRFRADISGSFADIYFSLADI